MRNWMNHRINPLHIYCRLVDIGLGKKTARKFSKWLESAMMVRGNNIASYRI